MATCGMKYTKILTTVLFSGNSFYLGGRVKNGTEFACVLMIPRVGQGLSVLQKHRTEKQPQRAYIRDRNYFSVPGLSVFITSS